MVAFHHNHCLANYLKVFFPYIVLPLSVLTVVETYVRPILYLVMDLLMKFPAEIGTQF